MQLLVAVDVLLLGLFLLLCFMHLCRFELMTLLVVTQMHNSQPFSAFWDQWEVKTKHLCLGCSFFLYEVFVLFVIHAFWVGESGTGCSVFTWIIWWQDTVSCVSTLTWVQGANCDGRMQCFLLLFFFLFFNCCVHYFLITNSTLENS